MDLWIFPETNVFASLTFLIASTQFRFLEGELELVYDAAARLQEYQFASLQKEEDK